MLKPNFGFSQSLTFTVVSVSFKLLLKARALTVLTAVPELQVMSWKELILSFEADKSLHNAYVFLM